MEQIHPEYFVECFRDQALLLVSEIHLKSTLFWWFFELQNEASLTLSCVLKNLFEFLKELGEISLSNACDIKEYNESYQQAMQLTRNLAEYIEQLQTEVPALEEG
jgi:hypothetical protein